MWLGHSSSHSFNMSVRVWKRIEKQVGTKVPIFLKDILDKTGFDNEWSIINLKEENIN